MKSTNSSPSPKVNARSLEKEMRGVSPKKASGMDFDEGDKPKAGAANKKRNLRSLRIERAEGGFTAHPDYEPDRSSKKNEPMFLDHSPKPHVMKSVDEIHEFVDEHWKD